MSSAPHRRRPRKKTGPKKPALPQGIFQVKIVEVGAKGDGIGTDDQGQNWYVPFSSAGDVVDARAVEQRGDFLVGEITQIILPGSERIEAPCPHYTRCGGCSLQHINDAAYSNWKAQRVQEALDRAQVAHTLEPAVLVPSGQRRRAAFAVMKKGKKIVFGFNARASHRIEEIKHCLLLTPQLDKLIPSLRELLPQVMKQEGRGDIIINAPDQSIDIVFALPGRVDLKVHEALMDFAQKFNISRLSWQEKGEGTPELIARRDNVTTTFGSTSVELPPAPFLQPSKQGEDALVRFAISALKKEKKILDLYAGCGSFTFALAQKGIVHAVEAHAPALKALETSAGRAGLGGRITTEVRDLTRQPLMGKELEKYDVILFDPPRAGAREQAEAIAQSQVGLVIAISCNPSTFARDARALIDGGYHLEKIMPVDQFTWSAHVEVCAIFRKIN